MREQHKTAIRVITLAAVLDVIGGLVFALVEHLSIGAGLYWAVATATSTGYGDVTPQTVSGRVVAVCVMLTVIPLFAATFSLVTSGLTSARVKKDNRGMHAKLDHIIKHHPDIPELTESGELPDQAA